ncbi:hypothetical protein CCHR01_17920 [Colletotrichum chrysophilum]|uniref:Uncharacterized protein n=1 Tax=Colletotrichum chrysophilum TaxID=1836956 RepID=A0AAD9A1M5_9PEZI|nr:hypothetical protein CCHR01_17920 [Colletotrichum chrysophilum]
MISLRISWRISGGLGWAFAVRQHEGRQVGARRRAAPPLQIIGLKEAFQVLSQVLDTPRKQDRRAADVSAGVSVKREKGACSSGRSAITYTTLHSDTQDVSSLAATPKRPWLGF